MTNPARQAAAAGLGSPHTDLNPSAVHRAGFALFAIAVLAVLAISVAKQPAMPLDDSALFEYFGNGLLHGKRLYLDMWDNKLPSIYVVNALWQYVFPSNYFVHALLEAAINFATIVLFAAILRHFGVANRQAAVLLFAAVYCLIIFQFNYTEFYATPLMLLAILLSLRGHPIWAGVALAAGSTFWIPLLVFVVPVSMCAGSKRERIVLATAMIASFAAYLAALVVAFGFGTILELGASWISYIFTTPVHTMLEHPGAGAVAHPGLAAGPVESGSRLGAAIDKVWIRFNHGFIEGGAAFLICLVACSDFRIKDPASKFALIWSITAFIAASVSGAKYFWHYFLPFYAPIIMLLATQHFSLRGLLSRWYVVLATAAFLLMTVKADFELARDERSSVAGAEAVGRLVSQSFGPAATVLVGGYIPELYLVTGGEPPNRFSVTTIAFANERATNLDRVVAFMDYADRKEGAAFEAPPRLAYRCAGPDLRPYAVRAGRPLDPECVRVAASLHTLADSIQISPRARQTQRRSN